MTTIIARAAESVHWYGQDGSPQYTVKAKDGSDRPTTLRDARKMNLLPSVTTILKVAAKPGLDVWKNEQLLLAALTLPRIDGESEKSFIARVVADSKETGKRAAERGTRVHESIEAWFEGVRPVEHDEIAKAFEESIFNHFKTHPFQPWQTETSFASELGYGGKVDLHNEDWVCDFKTTDKPLAAGQLVLENGNSLELKPGPNNTLIASVTIEKDGSVSTSSVKKTTMNNKPVENCIAAKIKGWTFPKPKGGGQVLVSYPFLFKSLN